MSKEPDFGSILEHDGAGFTYFRRHTSSLDPRLLLFVFGSLVLLSLVVATGFALAGAWLIIPFAGAEIAALGTAVWFFLRRAGDFERLTFTGDHILVEIRERGFLGQFEFHRGWVRLVTGQAGSVALHSHGRAVEIGRYSGEAGRRVLAQALRNRLGAHRI